MPGSDSGEEQVETGEELFAVVVVAQVCCGGVEEWVGVGVETGPSCRLLGQPFVAGVGTGGGLCVAGHLGSDAENVGEDRGGVGELTLRGDAVGVQEAADAVEQPQGAGQARAAGQVFPDPRVPVEGVEQGERKRADGVELIAVCGRFGRFGFGEHRIAGPVQEFAAVRDVPVDRPGTTLQTRREHTEGESRLSGFIEDADRRLDHGLSGQGGLLGPTTCGARYSHDLILTQSGTSIHYVLMKEMERPSIIDGDARHSRATRPQTLLAVWPALAGLAAVFLIEMLDTSVLNVTLPTITRDLSATATQLQWVSGSYTLVFGGLMLAFGSIADRFGRRRVMLVGLALFGLASLSILLVSSPTGLIAVRVLIGVAAAMTAPGSMALSFRLFEDDALRVRATALISTIGLVGLAIGPTIGGLILAVAPWKVLLLVNVPIALLAFLGIHFGIRADRPEELHRVPVDLAGALLGAATIVLALLAPTLFVDLGPRDPWPWNTTAAAIAGLAGFVLRQRLAAHPLLDLALFRRPSVTTGLSYQAALGLATAGLGYTVTLQLQLVWGWPPALAALGVLPQVLTMILIGPLVERIMKKTGLDRAGLIGSVAVVAGLLLYALCGRSGYGFIAAALVLIAAGMRITMITATINVMRGLPSERTSIGAALNDTAQEVASGIGIAVVGIIIAASITGSLTDTGWTPTRSTAFENAVTLGILLLTAAAVALLTAALIRTARHRTPAPEPGQPPATAHAQDA